MLHWRPTPKQVLWAIFIGSLLVALGIFIYLGYSHRWKWTGFPQKRLFDWMQILVIPIAVAIGTFALNRAAKRRDDKAQDQHAEEASLQAYLDYLSQMLTDPDRPLRRSQLGDNLSVVARAQTLTVLTRLQDGVRKRSALQFLYEAGLISKNHPVVSLTGANLSDANLSEAYLWEANLAGADLRGADLRGAQLRRAYLSGAKLSGANLSDANLRQAFLIRADLTGADLTGAILMGADLRGTNLTGADLRGAKEITQEQLEHTIGDETTKLPERRTMPASWNNPAEEQTDA
jgi:hypothetical protein